MKAVGEEVLLQHVSRGPRSREPPPRGCPWPEQPRERPPDPSLPPRFFPSTKKDRSGVKGTRNSLAVPSGKILGWGAGGGTPPPNSKNRQASLCMDARPGSLLDTSQRCPPLILTATLLRRGVLVLYGGGNRGSAWRHHPRLLSGGGAQLGLELGPGCLRLTGFLLVSRSLLDLAF